MVKAPWSSSGRGLQAITKTPVHEKVWEKLLGIVKEQGYAIVEPFRDKQLDLAFQFECYGGKIRFLGVSNFFTDSKGQYAGNHLNGLPNSVAPRIQQFVEDTSATVVETLMAVIGKSNLPAVYEGNFGVDTLIFNDNNGELKTNPCQEINLRQNMGLLALQLEKRIAATRTGCYRMWHQSGQTFCAFSAEMQKTHPLVLSNGKIESGFFPLTDAHHDSIFGAYLLV